MKNLIAALMIIMSLVACSSPEKAGLWVETELTVTISNNGGGHTLSFDAERARLEKTNKQVIINGYCASACTIFYSLPNACMAKGSSLHFHGSSGAPLGVLVADAILAKHYRAGIKEGFLNEWIHLTKPMKKLDRNQVRLLDPDTKFCENTKF